MSCNINIRTHACPRELLARLKAWILVASCRLSLVLVKFNPTAQCASHACLGALLPPVTYVASHIREVEHSVKRCQFTITYCTITKYGKTLPYFTIERNFIVAFKRYALHHLFSVCERPRHLYSVYAHVTTHPASGAHAA